MLLNKEHIMAGKRILIFGWAGSVHVQRWVKGLSQRGFEIKVVSLGGHPLPDVETKIFIDRGKLSYLTRSFDAASEVKSFKPDLVHVHYAGGFSLWGLAARFNPMLVSVWGSDVVDLPRKYNYRPVVRKVLSKATHISATSRMLAEVTRELVPGVGDKLSVIPFGVELPNPLEYPPPNPLKLCFIKGTKSVYGPEVLLQAIAKARQSIPDLQLSWAGSVDMTERQKALIRDLQMENCINVVGFVPHDNIFKFLSDHHLMIMPSLKEAFGVAVLEASAAGRAAIASNVGGVPEVLVDGKTGLLIPPNDPDRLAEAIIKLANDRELMKSLGENGRRFVEDNFAWSKSLDMMSDLYERLIYEHKEKQNNNTTA